MQESIETLHSELEERLRFGHPGLDRGFPYGYEGLTYRYGHRPVELTLAFVDRIHEQGGTILGSSRGNQDIAEMVDTLERMNIGILFTLGGDGTLRGAGAIDEEIERRKLKIAVIGIPKTIDNDISYIQRSFGFATAVSEVGRAIRTFSNPWPILYYTATPISCLPIIGRMWRLGSRSASPIRIKPDRRGCRS